MLVGYDFSPKKTVVHKSARVASWRVKKKITYKYFKEKSIFLLKQGKEKPAPHEKERAVLCEAKRISRVKWLNPFQPHF